MRAISQIARRIRGLGQEQDGAASLEFVIAALLVVTLLFGAIEYCSLVYTYTVLSDAANEGLRYLTVNSGDTAGATSKVTTYAGYSFHDTAALTVSVACSGVAGSCAPPSTAVITVTYPYVPYLSTFMSAPPTMHAYAEGKTVN
jgi:Flp pilus assembly protein TadG